MAFDTDDLDFGEEENAGIAAIFADRIPESKAFARALASHRRRLDDPNDSPVGRNVLVFHGHGGLGKSELSRRLDSWASGELPPGLGWGLPPATRVAATVRIDLHGSEGIIDGARQLASLRMQLGRVRHSWPLFDVAFAAYWAATHPGDPLPVTGSEEDSRGFIDSTLNSVAALADDRGWIAADSGLSSATAVVAPRIIQHIATGIAGRFSHKLGMRAPSGYGVLFDRCANGATIDNPRPDVLGQLARLLSYEIAQLPERPLIVVFIDTFERLALDARRTGESLLNRVAYSMGNVLFVVSGRSHLTWSETQGHSLPFRGPEAWPLLASGAEEEPHQHALEYLSDGDAMMVLESIRERLSVNISDDELEKLRESSGGLPEHLRLIGHALAARRDRADPVRAEELPRSFDELVLLLLADVPSEAERRAIRAAALLPACDAELVAATAGVDVGEAERALQRPLFGSVNSLGDAHTMHDRVREVIRGAGVRVQGGWSVQDWRRAGTRALEHLHGVRERLLSENETKGQVPDTESIAGFTARMLHTTGLAVSVVCEVEAEVGPAKRRRGGNLPEPAYVDWVSAAIVKAPSISGLRPHTPAQAKTQYGADILDLIASKTLELTLKERLSALERIFREGRQLSWIAGRHFAYALANASRFDESIAIMDELVALRPENTFVRYQRAVRLATARRFEEVMESVDQLEDGRRERMLARMQFFGEGHPEKFVELLAARFVEERADGALKDALETEGMVARWSPLVFANRRILSGPNLIDRAESAGHDAALRDGLVAEIMRSASAGDELQRLVTIDRARNEDEIGFREALAKAAIAWWRNDRSALEALAEEIGEREQARNYQWIPVEFLLESEGFALPKAPTEWLAPRRKNKERWARRWRDWRSSVE